MGDDESNLVCKHFLFSSEMHPFLQLIMFQWTQDQHNCLTLNGVIVHSTMELCGEKHQVLPYITSPGHDGPLNFAGLEEEKNNFQTEYTPEV